MSSCISTTTIIRDCKNPIEDLLSIILKTGDLDSLKNILDKGIMKSSCGICCPCPENGKGLYFLGSISTFYDLENILISQSEQVGFFNNNTCCSSFGDAIKEINCYMSGPTFDQYEYLLEKGIVEIGLINGESQLYPIIDWYNSNIEFLLKKKIKLIDVLQIILLRGIVFFCSDIDSQYYLLSVSAYQSLQEQTSEFNLPDDTCCINIMGDPINVSELIHHINNPQPVP
jgi:hypothetical protein